MPLFGRPEGKQPALFGRQAQKPQPQQQPGFFSRLLNWLPFMPINRLQRGTLVSCQYLFWKHDASPLILVTRVLPDRIKGVNLHYLTYNYVRNLILTYCGNSQFDYKFIKPDPYIVNAFRTYKKIGLRKIHFLDCNQIRTQLLPSLEGRTRTNPQEMKLIRDMIRQQLQRQVNPTAEEMARGAATPVPGAKPGIPPTAPRPATIPGTPATRPPMGA